MKKKRSKLFFEENLPLSRVFFMADCLRRLHCLLSTSSFNGELNHLARVLRADAKLWKGIFFKNKEGDSRVLYLILL